MSITKSETQPNLTTAMEYDEACFVDPPFPSESSKLDQISVIQSSLKDQANAALIAPQIDSGVEGPSKPIPRIDYLSVLPIELALYVLLTIGDDPSSLVRCRLVSKRWRTLAEDPVVWREIFKYRTNWRVKREFKQFPLPATSRPSLRSISSENGSQNQYRRSTVQRMKDIEEDDEQEQDQDQDQGREQGKDQKSTEALLTKVRDLIEQSIISEDSPPSPLPVLSRQNSIESYRTNGSGNRQVARRLSRLLGDSMANYPSQSEDSLSSFSSPSTSFQSSSAATQSPNANERPSLFGQYAVSSSSNLTQIPTPVDPLTTIASDKVTSLFDSTSPSSLGFPLIRGSYPNTAQGQPGNLPYQYQNAFEAEEEDPTLDWFQLYRDRSILENRWKEGKQKPTSLKGHADSIYCVQFDGDQRLITGSRDRSIKIWDLGSGECVETLVGHQGSVLCLRVENQKIISGSSDCKIIEWISGKNLKGGQLSASSTYAIENEYIGHGSGVLDLALNSKVIISCSKDMTIKVWDRENVRLIRTITGHQGPVNAIQILENRYPTFSENSPNDDDNDDSIERNCTRFLSASGDSSMKLWELESGRCIRSFEGHLRGLACIKVVEELGLVISGSKDENIRVWELSTGRCLKTLMGHEGLVRTLDVDVLQNRLVSGSYDRTIKVWDLEQGSLILDFRKRNNRFKSLVFDLKIDCKRIVSVGHDSNVMVLDFGYGIDCENFI